MVCDKQVFEVGERVIAAHRSGQPIARLPPELRPQTVDAVYAIHRHVSAALGPIAGWKVGASGPTVPPTCAPLYQSRVFTDGVTLPASDYHGLAVEVEFAFRVQKEIPLVPEMDRAFVESCVELVPLVEVIGSRFIDNRDFSPFESLLDGNANGAVIVGAPLSPWPGFEFKACPVRLMIDDVCVQDALNTHPLGDPTRLLHWQVAFCRAMGFALTVGTLITTGSLRGATRAKAGQKIRGYWGDVLGVSLQFS